MSTLVPMSSTFALNLWTSSRLNICLWNSPSLAFCKTRYISTESLLCRRLPDSKYIHGIFTFWTSARLDIYLRNLRFLSICETEFRCAGSMVLRRLRNSKYISGISVSWTTVRLNYIRNLGFLNVRETPYISVVETSARLDIDLLNLCCLYVCKTEYSCAGSLVSGRLSDSI